MTILLLVAAILALLILLAYARRTGYDDGFRTGYTYAYLEMWEQREQQQVAERAARQ